MAEATEGKTISRRGRGEKMCIRDRLVGDFQHPWPTATLRVEIVAYANFGGAYTTENPPLIAMSSLDLEQQGDDALEELSLIHI